MSVAIEQYFPKKQHIIEDIGFGEFEEKYINPSGRTLASTPVERLIYAEKLCVLYILSKLFLLKERRTFYE